MGTYGWTPPPFIMAYFSNATIFLPLLFLFVQRSENNSLLPVFHLPYFIYKINHDIISQLRSLIVIPQGRGVSV